MSATLVVDLEAYPRQLLLQLAAVYHSAEAILLALGLALADPRAARMGTYSSLYRQPADPAIIHLWPAALYFSGSIRPCSR